MFTQFNSLQVVCNNPTCAIDYAKTEDGRKRFKAIYRRETREMKDRSENRSSLKQKAGAACRRYIRARDRAAAMRQGVNPYCCSCLTEKDVQYCAGHYKTAGAHPELEFNEFNIHLQCNRYCNSGLSGNIKGNKTSPGYEVFMVNRYGRDYVDSLDGRPPANYTHDELKEIKQLYNYFATQLEKELKEA